jgi:hypothetical protein
MAFGIDDAIAAALKVVDKFIPDPEAKAKYEQELRSDLKDWDKGQMEVNAAEAQHSSIFVAGWRPMVGWIGAVAFGYHVILLPIIVAIATAKGYKVELPAFDKDLLEFTLYGLLGLGGLRTFEKHKGISK